MQPLDGQRVTVMGLGRFGGGVGVTRFLVEQGADVLVTDTEPAETLAASVAQLDDFSGVSYRLGEHNVSDFTTCDLVVANPAVKPGNRFLRAAAAAGIPITTEMRLLVQRLPNRLRTIGITGSAGKSTVTAMIGHVLERAGKQENRRTGRQESEHKAAGPLRGPVAAAPRAEPGAEGGSVLLGGNLGGSLLPRLGEITADDWVVLELSSFMLHYLGDTEHGPGWSPRTAVVTNISANHLDWHGDLAGYARDKQRILDHQWADDLAILGPAEGFAIDLAHHARGRVLRIEPDDAAGIELAIPGEHNRLNAAIALAVCGAVGVSWPTPRDRAEALASFPGLPHRMQLVAEHNGVRFFNDSKCTTPEAAHLALDSFDRGQAHIILGGYDKGTDLSALARYAGAHAAGVYTIGVTGDAIADAVDRAKPQAAPGRGGHVIRCGDLDAAVREAVARATPGQVVLLSPACASWDQFENFEQRGRAFGELVLRWTAEPGG